MTCRLFLDAMIELGKKGAFLAEAISQIGFQDRPLAQFAIHQSKKKNSRDQDIEPTFGDRKGRSSLGLSINPRRSRSENNIQAAPKAR